MRFSRLTVAVAELVAVAALFPAPAVAGGTPVALVTCETKNQLVAVDPWSGRVLRRVRLAAGPEDVAASPGSTVVVTSGRAGVVTLLDWRTLRSLAVLHGFATPHIAAIAPGGMYGYVTDDASGQLAVIEFATRRVVARIEVGAQAHHIGVSPDGRQLWIALGQNARAIVLVDVTHRTHPRVTGRFDPGVTVHDLAFSPDGLQVWATSGDAPWVSVFSATSRKLLFKVAAPKAPQHVAFNYNGRAAFITSGYDSMIELANTSSGRIVRRAAVPYGSFELSTSGSLIVTASLLRGSLTLLDDQLRIRHITQVAPVTREVALIVW
jgi:DNA-binding beta-propeller fold protein YncE